MEEPHRRALQFLKHGQQKEEEE